MLGLKDEVPEIVEPPPPPVFVEDWTTVYYEITDAATDTLEFHVNKGYVEIQKIFVNSVDDPDGAVVLLDFTTDPPTVDASVTDREAGGEVVAGEKYVLTSDGDYVFGGKFKSALFATNSYIGFVIKSSEDDSALGLDDARILLKKGTTEIITVRFSALDEGGFDFTEWTPAYFDLDKYGLDGSFDRFHFHANNWDGGGFVEIQKILVNDSKSLTGATTVLDFTQADPKVAAYDYWFQTVEDDGTADGRIIMDGTISDYQGNFGSGAASDNDATYWIFIVRTTSKSKSDMGDIRFEVPATAGVAGGALRIRNLEF